MADGDQERISRRVEPRMTVRCCRNALIGNNFFGSQCWPSENSACRFAWAHTGTRWLARSGDFAGDDLPLHRRRGTCPARLLVASFSDCAERRVERRGPVLRSIGLSDWRDCSRFAKFAAIFPNVLLAARPPDSAHL